MEQGTPLRFQEQGIYYGYDYYEKILLTALGEDVDFTSPEAEGIPNASMLLMSDRDGVIVSQTNGNPDDPDIVDIQFDYEPGHAVHKFRVGPHRIGHVITKGKSLDDAVALLHKALDNIDITVE